MPRFPVSLSAEWARNCPAPSVWAGFGGLNRKVWTNRGRAGHAPRSMADLDPMRVLEHVHGHLGWLSAASLLHPAIVLRNPRRRAHLAVGLSVAFVTATGAIGAYLYGPYRDTLKQQIFIHTPSVGYLFERKEHLAFGAVLLAWAGAIAYAAATRAEEGLRAPLRTFAFRAFVGACLLTVCTAVLGVAVAVVRTF